MIAGLKPYPDMKDSGVQWLGKVPKHWEVRRLRNVADMRVSNVDKHVKADENLVRLCNYVDVYKNDYINKQMDFMQVTATNDEIERFRLERDDVLITKDSETWDDIGVPALVTKPASDLISGYHLALLRPRYDKLAGAYLLRALQSKGLAYQFHIEAKGVTRYGLSHAGIKSVWLPLPPLPEQTAIVRFLDHADRRIRRYIRAKQKLIALLEEQKQAIIHQAVTGQIDVRTGRPYSSYKDSGVEWLGEVPEHWEVRRLRTVAGMRVSNVDKHTKEGELPVRLCNYVDVYKNDRITQEISFMKATASQDEIERFRLKQGDVLITKDSEAWDDIGVPALVTEPADDLISGYHLALLRPLKQMLGAYLAWTLQSQAVAHQFHVEAKGVTRYGLTHAGIQSVNLPLPSHPEQIAIVAYLDKTSAAIDTSISRTYRQMEVLREYRTRLIADVVTGKLDVREAAAELPEVDSIEAEDTLGDTFDTDTELDSAELDATLEEANA